MVLFSIKSGGFIMTKKLFLITTLSLASGLQLFGNPSEMNLLSFISQLKRLPHADYIETAAWMERTFVATDEYHQNMTGLLTNIINGNISVEQKINAIIQLKTTEEQTLTKKEKSAFLATIAKATAAILIVTGVAYYCYTARPWTKFIN